MLCLLLSTVADLCCIHTSPQHSLDHDMAPLRSTLTRARAPAWGWHQDSEGGPQPSPSSSLAGGCCAPLILSRSWPTNGRPCPMERDHNDGRARSGPGTRHGSPPSGLSPTGFEPRSRRAISAQTWDHWQQWQSPSPCKSSTSMSPTTKGGTTTPRTSLSCGIYPLSAGHGRGMGSTDAATHIPASCPCKDQGTSYNIVAGDNT